MQLIFSGLLRGGIPFVIMSVIALILNFQGKSADAWSTFCTALIILFVGAATVIYNIERFSLFKQTLLHIMIMLVTVYPVLLLSGWFPLRNFGDALFVLLIFFVVGAVLWVVFLLLAKIFDW
ncbi:hypothetical protein LFYK43_06530 [Ligilactobacillus salitolerans]|uniref:DUF3021 domain-containing protein n=1 Tax=Ligilactobacillus salitolerans TaxID=1808352 RepID=A0A401IRR5_9LACO|nr:DUF3021 family protein [Ligilactobacillus salitolerans]GBG94194.1 hypothetical protein LFYK43_06530 [Ligilactobacillus salitolerans]